MTVNFYSFVNGLLILNKLRYKKLGVSNLTTVFWYMNRYNNNNTYATKDTTYN